MYMEEPCFHVLRTKFKLAYNPHSDKRCLHDVIGFSVTVVSSAKMTSVPLLFSSSAHWALLRALGDWEKKQQNVPRPSFGGKEGALQWSTLDSFTDFCVRNTIKATANMGMAV